MQKKHWEVKYTTCKKCFLAFYVVSDLHLFSFVFYVIWLFKRLYSNEKRAQFCYNELIVFLIFQQTNSSWSVFNTLFNIQFIDYEVHFLKSWIFFWNLLSWSHCVVHFWESIGHGSVEFELVHSSCISCTAFSAS